MTMSAEMTFLIRRRNSQVYLQPCGEWDSRRDTAMEFESSSSAFCWAQDRNLLGIDIVLACEDPSEDFVTFSGTAGRE